MFSIHFEQIWVFSEKSAAPMSPNRPAGHRLFPSPQSHQVQQFVLSPKLLSEDSFFLFCRSEYLNPRIEASIRCFQHFCGNNIFETIVVSYLCAILQEKYSLFWKIMKKKLFERFLIWAHSQKDHKNQRHYFLSDCLH
jgi:hypothetical protein